MLRDGTGAAVATAKCGTRSLTLPERRQHAHDINPVAAMRRVRIHMRARTRSEWQRGAHTRTRLLNTVARLPI